MVKTKYAVLVILGIVVLSLVLSCSSSETPDKEFETRLLVRAPDRPLQINKPVTVISRADDPDNNISRIELVLISTPHSEDENMVVAVTLAPDEQTVLTAEQVFIPSMPGNYVLKAVGYNKNEQDKPTESQTISFTAQ